MSQVNCGHPACRCSAAVGQQFCSEQCRSLSTQTPEQLGRCNCGHPGCRQHASDVRAR
jgi:hypothetical protein